MAIVATGSGADDTPVDVSIVVPVFNEAPALVTLFARLEQSLGTIERNFEVILIDDGSTDASWLEITSHTPVSFRTHCIALSRNFGKEAALTCGLRAASGDAVIILDADCQDPPELIPQMLDAWTRGADVVNMQRRSRDGESQLKILSSAAFYRLLNWLSDTPLPRDVGDFRLLSRRVVDEINRLDERNRYMKGILAWPGFNQLTLEYDREARSAGTSKWNYWQLFGLSLAGITGFSNKPLRLASWLGLSISLVAFLYAVFVFFRTLIFGDPVSGYPSMMIIILFMGGIQLVTIGILGEYVGRIFTEVKGRPNYIIRETRSVTASALSRPSQSIRS